MKAKLSKLFRWLPLLNYKAGQHDLICDATKTNKDYLDDGYTAYESVCYLMMKLNAATRYIESQDNKEATELIDFLKSDIDSTWSPYGSK